MKKKVRRRKKKKLEIYKTEKRKLAERGFDPRTSGLWAQHASTAPLCCSHAIIVQFTVLSNQPFSRHQSPRRTKTKLLIKCHENCCLPSCCSNFQRPLTILLHLLKHPFQPRHGIFDRGHTSLRAQNYIHVKSSTNQSH